MSMRIAIVGSGVSGLVCAHLLGRRHEVTVYEAEGRPGGHAHTHKVALPDADLDLDTGFLVYNDRTYPGLVRLFEELHVATAPSEMSFSVSDERTGLEWRGTSAGTVFAQRRNLVRPSFLEMLTDVVRFNRLARSFLAEPPPPGYTVEDLLGERRWSRPFVDWYLVPLGSSIWSAGKSVFGRMPASTLARFFDRHGLLSLGDQPRWRTVAGGSARYVDAVLRPVRDAGRLRLGTPVDRLRRTADGVSVVSRAAPDGETYDHVVVATHSDQALSMLEEPSSLEREVLGAIRYRPNRATLHTDRRLLPAQRRAWASWNYHVLEKGKDQATLTYNLNRLQGLKTRSDVLVTLNRDDAVDPAKVLRRIDYAHPVIDTDAVVAQRRHRETSGRSGVSYCGAYWGYGFHEDGVQSALAVCRHLGVAW